MTRTLSRTVTVLLVVALAAATAWYVLLRPDPRLRIAADFPAADGIFAGSRVALLGVPVGHVEEVRPRGSTVRVTMSLPGESRVPRDAHAYIMSPAVVSDRFVELSPAHTSGPSLEDGAVIPVERTHAPVKWDELTTSLDELLTALGPQGADAGGGIGGLLSTAADSLGGNGPAFREALSDLTQATDVVASASGDIGAVLDNVDRLLELLADHRSTLDILTTTVSQVSADITEQQTAITQSIDQLSHALGTFSRLLTDHGDELTGDVSQLTDLTTTVVARQRELAETLDTLPLALDNFGRAVTHDDRLRIRLNLSTNLSQFGTTRQLCEQLPIPLCAGAGLVNPIDFPPRIPDVLGLGTLLGGGGR